MAASTGFCYAYPLLINDFHVANIMSDSKSRQRDPNKRQRLALERRIQNALTTIYDPATPNIDLYNMGMIYQVRIELPGSIEIDLAYSSPGHPGNIGLLQQVESTIRELEGVKHCKVNVVTDPPWTLDRVSDHARINMSVVN
jgi:metal-sulfur cluster biosynthetic enzyme